MSKPTKDRAVHHRIWTEDIIGHKLRWNTERKNNSTFQHICKRVALRKWGLFSIIFVWSYSNLYPCLTQNFYCWFKNVSEISPRTKTFLIDLHCKCWPLSATNDVAESGQQWRSIGNFIYLWSDPNEIRAWAKGILSKTLMQVLVGSDEYYWK